MQMTTENPVASITPSSESPDGVSDADTQCAVSRYSEYFAGKDTSPAAVRNGLKGDIDEYYGVLTTCANNLTEYQTQHMIWDYPDLQQKYGKGQEAIEPVKTYYTDYGFAQGR
jgi:hypothetical protein